MLIYVESKEWGDNLSHTLYDEAILPLLLEKKEAKLLHKVKEYVAVYFDYVHPTSKEANPHYEAITVTLVYGEIKVKYKLAIEKGKVVFTDRTWFPQEDRNYWGDQVYSGWLEFSKEDIHWLN